MGLPSSLLRCSPILNLWDRPGGNLVPDAQQLADDHEFDATLANGFVADH
jgi:hypothetical protein